MKLIVLVAILALGSARLSHVIDAIEAAYDMVNKTAPAELRHLEDIENFTTFAEYASHAVLAEQSGRVDWDAPWHNVKKTSAGDLEGKAIFSLEYGYNAQAWGMCSEGKTFPWNHLFNDAALVVVDTCRNIVAAIVLCKAPVPDQSTFGWACGLVNVVFGCIPDAVHRFMKHYIIGFDGEQFNLNTHIRLFAIHLASAFVKGTWKCFNDTNDWSKLTTLFNISALSIINEMWKGFKEAVIGELVKLAAQVVIAITLPGIGTSVTTAKISYKLANFIKNCYELIGNLISYVVVFLGNLFMMHKMANGLGICAFLGDSKKILNRFGCSDSKIKKLQEYQENSKFDCVGPAENPNKDITKA